MLTQTLLDLVSQTLLDEGTVRRYTTATLLDFLNKGLREIITYEPEANTVTENVTLVSGAKQTVPSDVIRVIEFTRNMGTDGATPGRVLERDTKILVDSYNPAWQQGTASAVTISCMYDEQKPKEFYVYPPSDGTNKIELISSKVPSVADEDGSLPVKDSYVNMLHDYMVGSALMFDADAESVTKGELYLQKFREILTIKEEVDRTSEAK